jgi:hypothetical protein
MWCGGVLCVVAPVGAGKQFFLVNSLFHMFRCGDKGTFSTIHIIITRNKDER